MPHDNRLGLVTVVPRLWQGTYLFLAFFHSLFSAYLAAYVRALGKHCNSAFINKKTQK